MALLLISNIIIIHRNISQMRRTIFVPKKSFDVLMVSASTKKLKCKQEINCRDNSDESALNAECEG